MDRRGYLRMTAAGSAIALSGCLELFDDEEDPSDDSNDDDQGDNGSDTDDDHGDDEPLDAATVSVASVNEFPEEFADQFVPEDSLVPALDFWEEHSADVFDRPVEFDYTADQAPESSDIVVTWLSVQDRYCSPDDNPAYDQGPDAVACGPAGDGSMPEGVDVEVFDNDPRVQTGALTVVIGRAFGASYGDGPEDAMNGRRQLFPQRRTEAATGYVDLIEDLHTIQLQYGELYVAISGEEYGDAQSLTNSIHDNVDAVVPELHDATDELRGVVSDEFIDEITAYIDEVDAVTGYADSLNELAEEESNIIPDSVPAPNEIEMAPEIVFNNLNYEVWSYYVQNG